MPAPIGFAIVGRGHASQYHFAALQACARRGARLVAVATRSPADDTLIRARFGVPAMTFSEICNHPEVDVVAICTPSGCHAQQGVRAALAGKHLIVEKPMAIELAGADAMLAASTNARRLLAVAYQRRTQVLFKRLRYLLREAVFGTPLLANLVLPYRRDSAYFTNGAWRGSWHLDGGGVLMNQAIHFIDLLVWFWGDPVSVQAVTATRHQKIDVEDTAVVNLRFASGVLATIAATTAASPGFRHRVAIYGTRGGILIEGDRVIRCRQGDGDGLGLFPRSATADDGRRSDKAAGHIALYHNFLDALETGAPLICDGVEGRRSLEALLRIYVAADAAAASADA
ncbi:MAG: Gfo/Idh/MocA family oxidoreductase [Desulfosarcinaceae bacterium]|nr:Gfo/Idh/MocA family oxidoreductase [Desulfosarcinaceae bacterium]